MSLLLLVRAAATDPDPDSEPSSGGGSWRRPYPMPFVVRETNQCPVAERWGVFNKTTGDLKGCHATIADAQAQQQALYANTPEARHNERAPLRPPPGEWA